LCFSRVTLINTPASTTLFFFSQVLDMLEPLLADGDEDVRESAGTALGCLSRHIAPDEVSRLVTAYAVGTDDWTLQHGRACALRDIVCFAQNLDSVPLDVVVACATRLLQSDNVQVQGGGFAVAAAVMAHGNYDLDKLVSSIVSSPSAGKDLFSVLADAFSSVAMRRAELPVHFVGFAVGILYVVPIYNLLGDGWGSHDNLALRTNLRTAELLHASR
jgi:hypothetical protein